MPRLTDASIRRLPGPPAGKAEITHWDTATPGLGLRVYASGRRTFLVRYRVAGRQRFVTLGAVDVATARKVAAEIVANAKLGRDLRAEAERARARTVTFGEVVRAFLAERRRELRPRTLIEYRRYLERHLADWHRLPVVELDRATVAGRIAGIARESGPVAAARCRTYLGACLAWAMRRGIADLEANPTASAWAPAPPPPRDRVLGLEELALVWRAADPATDFGAIVRLLILTGARRAEVAGMQWSEVDFGREAWVLPAARSKNGRPHLVPLSEPALAILAARPRFGERDAIFGRGPGGFSGWSRAKAALDRRIAALAGRPLAPWTIHDIRRSAVTGMAEAGVPPHVIEAVVNHVSGHKGGVAGVYNRAGYEAEKRSALETWAQLVLEAADEVEPAGRVVMFTGGRP